MKQTIIQIGNRAVVVTSEGNGFAARLYVNARDGLAHASATTVARRFKSAAGAQRWASAQVAA